jgi:integrase
MTKIRLKFIHRFKDRHGKTRHCFRRPGFKKISLPGLPGSDEFMTAYKMALSGQDGAAFEIGSKRTIPGTLSALVVAYFNSAEYHGLSKSTRATYRGIIERMRKEHGDKRVSSLKQEHIRKMLSQKCETPSAANNWLRIVRLLMRFAIEHGLREDDPTLGVRKLKIRTNGFYTWSEDDIAAFEEAHSIGSRARLALSLLLYTAQRRSDIIRMGRQHIRNGILSIRQQKTGTLVEIPIHSNLQNSLDSTPSNHLTFLTTKDGKPFTPAGFTKLVS